MGEMRKGIFKQGKMNFHIETSHFCGIINRMST